MRAITVSVALLLVSALAIRAEEAPGAPPTEHAHQPGAQPPTETGPSGQAAGPEPHGHVVSHVVEHSANGPVHHYGVGQQQPAYYAAPAAGLIQVVASEPHQPGSIANKPIGSTTFQGASGPRHYSAGGPGGPQQQQGSPHAAGAAPGAEQYGQPESASIPTNYKPFGSWGLYIGGNPADGYYTNYYKSLTNSVEKQAAQANSGPGPVGPQSQVMPGETQGVNKPVAVNGPMVRQASGPVYGVSGGPAGGEVYPFEHSPAASYYQPGELNTGVNRFVSAAQQSDYGTPSASYAPSSSLLTYADPSVYAASTKRFSQRDTQAQYQPAKGQQQYQYQTRMGYAYASPALQASGAQQGQQQPQVVAYPVPVGSQIVGSQPGVEGSFQPYGVHAFTRYAVRPVASGSPASQSSSSQGEQAYYSPATAFASGTQQPAYQTAYKQQYAYGQQSGQPQYQYQPQFSFYGYPMSQLHYSTGSFPSSPQSSGGSSSAGPAGSPFVSSFAGPEMFQHVGGPVGPVEPVMAAGSEKVETTVQDTKPVAASPVVGSVSGQNSNQGANQKSNQKA